MVRPGPQLRFIIIHLILVAHGLHIISAEQNVGCFFSERLCVEDEWCYDDFAFGRCLPSVENLDKEDLYRYDLEKEELHELSRELRRLFALGYRWSHGYTQCRLQAMLYSLKNDIDFELDSCTHLTDNDLEGALKALEGQVELNPQEIAIIKYTPSAENEHTEYADEVYYPPSDNRAREELRKQILGTNPVGIMDMGDPYADYAAVKRKWIPPMKRHSVTPFFDERYGIKKYHGFESSEIDPAELKNYDLLEDDNIQTGVGNPKPTIKFLDMRLTPDEIHEFLSPENYEKLQKLLARFEEGNRLYPDMLPKKLFQQRLADLRERFPYNIRNNIRDGYESRDVISSDEVLSEPRIYYNEDQVEQLESDTDNGQPSEMFTEGKLDFPIPKRQFFREMEQRQKQDNEKIDRNWEKLQEKPVVYSEGGAEPGAVETQEELINLRVDLDNILDDMGFKRPERLDVKKPGPPFDTQITGLKERADLKRRLSQKDFIPSMIKKEPRAGGNPNMYSDNQSKDSEGAYVHIEFKKYLRDWKLGKDIIRNISNLLHMEPNDFVDGHVWTNSVAFKVNPNNNRGYNESDVARRIETIQEELEKLSGVEIVSVGVGTKVKMQTVLFNRIVTENQYIVLFLVCGVLVALILATIVLTLIRRHVKSKEKLRGLSRPETEASKDYQDLCRARMATKGQGGGSESAADKGRITSLSKESEQSPSSRSSTSSWSEEPALHNMDISTGHMVLSYMEDHLKNKDRLEQEWVALCAYVAEPCESSVALRKENIEKNRYPNVVPYDHARVILNELSNASDSDYINASSITDHDPRNPAYIATQGPLPHTASDFWQMIWEQGAVVIVMLTRLTEGGTAMCHRYWPEEGSEVYQIYEVHLVSEHIWCDDYLVRSFYLKNVRTSETRTVTQFHFLSWLEAGVPISTKALLEFRRKVNKSYRGRSCPIVVHCSDGAGRTGTYCLIDMVLSRMAKGAKEIDIAATLEHLRDQRPKMVATKQQFEFVLTAVAEEVHAILKALPPQPLAPPQDKQEK
ncbi:receptor-type tyrosine-protein phosphatase N2 [Cylas formicarius]|uniref:receptor-type tyrosine-protein phosphatase N2 n=1 Tax=Cylas formicarius TaxID=197179 RepID=UPI002958B93F|nr:receptor-type tyrosine-protein phosphatase N2 [Cylas formicarius]